MKLSILSATALACAGITVSAAPTSPPVHIPLTRTLAAVSPVQRVASHHAHRISKRKGVPLGDIPYMGQRDQYWNIPVTMGRNQTFMMCMDTGSEDIWLRGAGCVSPDTSCDPTRPHINISDPRQFTNTSLTYSIVYGVGEVNGTVVQGDFSIGAFTARKSYFGVSKYEDTFDEEIDGGMLGLGLNRYSHRSTVGKVTNGKGPLESLGVDSFGLYLQNSDDGDSGLLTFNGIDPSKYQGSLTYFPVHNATQGFWSLSTLDSTLSLGNTTAPISVPFAITDSGTATIGLGTPEADAILAHFNVSDDGFVDCDVAKTGPDLVISLQGRPFVIPAEMYVVKGTPESPQCALAITGGAEDVHGGVLGAPFMRAYYINHDIKNKRMGMAKAIHPKAKGAVST
ncbi:hypothetical protein HKX48_002648 [Thoreauomyces humboldtii]|nr:hypothetical protein HKX48_002648 [Thoreauomyces humboldtii]